eukprot:scaffold1183_cov418-Prasinococcus_capsulatus_cf.AAC.6
MSLILAVRILLASSHWLRWTMTRLTVSLTILEVKLSLCVNSAGDAPGKQARKSSATVSQAAVRPCCAGVRGSSLAAPLLPTGAG